MATTKPTPKKKYATLGQTFLKGTIRGQINAVHKTRATNPDRVADFKTAIENRDVHLRPAQLSPQLKQKLAELGISV